MTEPITDTKTYVLVAVALLVLTFGTIGASFLNLGAWHVPVALAFAVAKATLVVLFFMHVRYSSPLTRIVIIVALVWLGILMVGSLNDYLTRTWLDVAGH